MKRTLIIAFISLFASVIIIVIMLMLPKTEPRKAVTVTTASGDIASQYKSFEDIMENQQDFTDGMPDVIMGEDTVVASCPEDNKVYYFCGSKNGEIFHTLNCSAIKNIKAENKLYFSTKEECINNGYKPCSRCNP